MKLLFCLFAICTAGPVLAQRPDAAIQVAREHISAQFGIPLSELSDPQHYIVSWEELVSKDEEQRLWITLAEVYDHTQCRVEIKSKSLEVVYANCLQFLPDQGFAVTLAKTFLSTHYPKASFLGNVYIHRGKGDCSYFRFYANGDATCDKDSYLRIVLSVCGGQLEKVDSTSCEGPDDY